MLIGIVTALGVLELLLAIDRSVIVHGVHFLLLRVGIVPYISASVLVSIRVVVLLICGVVV